MKYVLLYSGLWQVPEQKFKWLLQAIIENSEFQMSNYGTLIGQIDADVSTIKSDQAQELLNRYDNSKSQ